MGYFKQLHIDCNEQDGCIAGDIETCYMQPENVSYTGCEHLNFDTYRDQCEDCNMSVDHMSAEIQQAYKEYTQDV